ncbi:endonuclease VII domain-containing protein [Rhodococcus fascians]|nr:endonuclease VII domain-containing protein [Rhodococcus fascians]MBY4237776.1 endonuclease VII domain-containing protein [Rhodococcus fascians]MBY4253979.1 endonuclease VII domain-containing protein [Rhodococcus fascians]MBY4269150.1 endonuclease VII domain-containing protein [Rhodococcus fascians]
MQNKPRDQYRTRSECGVLKERIKRCIACASELDKIRKQRNKSQAPSKRPTYDNPDGSRSCRRCGVSKRLEDFPFRDRLRGTRRNECRACTKTIAAARNLTNVEARAERMRKRNYGLEFGQYAQMLEAQNNLCAICGQPEKSKHFNGKARRLFVDHDHSSGAVRALLCMTCNLGIGNFFDNSELMQRASKYIETHRVA